MKPVSMTAFLCCGARALDARARHYRPGEVLYRPIVGDQYAERLMTTAGWKIFERFRDFHSSHAASLARHSIIDGLITAELARRPATTVLVIGAGLCSRAFRLPAGRWIELDGPELLDLKEERLPAHLAPNPCERVAIEFDKPLEAALLAFRHCEAPIIAIEGVFGYLSAREAEELLRAIRSTFAHPRLILDLSTLTYTRRSSTGPDGERLRARLRELGAPPYGRLEVEPIELIRAEGFRMSSSESICARASVLRELHIPRRALASDLRWLRDGYQVACFESTESTTSGEPLVPVSVAGRPVP